MKIKTKISFALSLTTKEAELHRALLQRVAENAKNFHPVEEQNLALDMLREFDTANPFVQLQRQKPVVKNPNFVE